MLSPAYDINPNPEGRHLALNIDDQSSAIDLDLCLSVAGFFELGQSKAQEIIRNMRDVVRNWQKVAAGHGISQGEISSMASAFAVTDNLSVSLDNAFVSNPTASRPTATENPCNEPAEQVCSEDGCARQLRFSESTPQARIDAKLCSKHFQDRRWR